ncbi:hypothetical protein B0H10DRAFT_872874 [Mycena sp. CBHHK59/15]|nr:hypothetical protein B0H10DRAFT_872874 [Mycena sp. CBHHK59/15]
MDASAYLDDATFAWDHRIYRYIFLSGLVILVYDHLLTLGSEVMIIWSSKLRLSTCWFLMVRYTAIAVSIVYAFFYFGNLSPEVCIEMEKVLEGLLCIQEALVEVTLGVRVFAMYGLNLWILLSLLVPGSISAAFALWTIIEYGRPVMLTAPGFGGCHTAIPKSTAIRLAAAWEAQLFCDIVVFGLTLRRAYVDRGVLGVISGSLIDRMLRDGAMYFGIIVLANLANVLTLYLGDIILAGILSWFTTSLSVTLICRLMLRLHKAGTPGMASANHETSELETLRFVGPAPVNVIDEDV